MILDQYGNPLVADPIGPMYGPVRFEDQPAWVRKRGRKGKALSSRKAASRGGRKATRRSRKASRKSSNAKDYRKFLAARSETYGPVRFEDQPAWVRSRGRKGNLGRKRGAKGRYVSARRATARMGRKAGRKASRRSRGTVSRRERKRLNRQMFRAMKTRSKRSSRGVSRKRSSKRSARGVSRKRSVSKRSSRGMLRSARRTTRKIQARAGKVLSYSALMGQLRRKPKLKAWVCVGRTRTGCGGGRKGKRGSRQFGILRP